MKRFIAIIIGLSASNLLFAQGPFNVGTIHPGDSIVVYYDVTVNNPLVPPTTTFLSNQGAVSGSNFANVPTNDPTTATAGDATLTPLNTPLPVVFSEFKAYRNENFVELAWKIVSEDNALKYEIEKSADARAFTKIGEVMATGGSGVINYGFTDETPFPGNNYYRLKALDLDATYAFTRIVKVAMDEAASTGNLYPNPVIGKVVNIELLNLAKGKYNVTLINTAGQTMFTKQIDHAGGTGSQLITIPENISSGVYSAEIKGGSTKIYKKLVVK